MCGLDGLRLGRPHRPHAVEVRRHGERRRGRLGGTDTFDAEDAECSRAFMRASLNDDNRSPAFGPEMPAPEQADAYSRIAAFAGRTV